MSIFPKLKVKPPKMAHHDLSHYFRTSMAVGPLYPILCQELTPGQEVQLDFESLVNTQALLTPLYGSYQIKIESFFAGTSLYIPKLWRNGSMAEAGTQLLDATYPTFRLTNVGPSDMRVVNPSSLLAYLGLNPFFPAWSSDGSRPAINAIPLLMYLDIFRHYYANRQEANAPFTMSVTGGAVTEGQLSMSELDNLFLELPVNGGDMTSNATLTKLISQYTTALGGFLLRTYMPDRMNVILNKDFYEKNVTSVQVSTAGDSFQIDQLVTAKKLWNSRNKDAMTSGTFKDWIKSHFGVTPKIMDDMPTFLGATSSNIIFEDIRATTFAKDGDVEQYLGDKGSSGSGYLQSRRHRFVADRPGYLMVLASIVPRVDYYQSVDRYAFHGKLSDSFRPEFNNIGLQDVLISDLNYDFSGVNAAATMSDTNNPAKNAVGKQPAWIEYMTAVNKVRGTFCTTEKSWVLARDMRNNPALTGDVSTAGPVANTNVSAYIHPDEWNQPFAVQDASAQNFLAQFFVREFTRSTVLKRLLPKF